MNKSGFISMAYFDKKGFLRLIDPESLLDFETKQYFWEEYVISNNQDIETFYEILGSSDPTSRYIKRAIGKHFFWKDLFAFKDRSHGHCRVAPL